MKNKIVSDNNFEQQLRQELKELVTGMPIKNAVYFEVASQNWRVSVSQGGVGLSGDDGHLLMFVRSSVAIVKGIIPKVIVRYNNKSITFSLLSKDEKADQPYVNYFLEGLPIRKGDRGNLYFQDDIRLSLDFQN